MNIVIGIGHCASGGIDSGAVGLLNESNCTREVGAFAKSYLEKAGHRVTLARIDKASSVNESLSYRVNLANSISNVDVFAEIHLNAGGGRGSEVFICATGGKAERYAHQVLDKLVALGYYNRGVKTGNLYVIRKTVAPAILIECCFVDSEEDANRYNADALGKAIAEGLINSSINTITTQPEPSEGFEGGFKEMNSIYKNGSTEEPVYETTACIKKIGSLNPYEVANCIGQVGDKAIVLYKVNGTNSFKVGFCRWLGGIQ